MRIAPHQLRHTLGTSLVNAGMNLPALMALLGHVTPEMTLRYAKVASPTVRAAYQAAMDKIRDRRPLFVVPANGATAVPAKVDWLHSEMLKTRLAHGFCSRDPIAGACPYANICEQCDNFVPDPDRPDILAAQLDDVHALHDDADQRGWNAEAARHQRVAEPELAVTDRQHRGAHPPAFQIAQQVSPRLGGLPVTIRDRDELLGTIGADTHDHQGTADPLRAAR